MAQNPRILRFPARGGLVGQNVNCKKVADNHPGERGNFYFNGPKPHEITVSNHGGSEREKRNLRKTFPDSVVTFFFDFGTAVALGPRKGPAGLVACLLLLLARRASSTLVP